MASPAPTPPRVVYDTMIVFQMATRLVGLPATLRAAEDRRVTLCISRASMDEVKDVLSRPDLARRYRGLTLNRVDALLGRLRHVALWIDPVPPVVTFAAHPDDDHLLNLAVAASADYLVTWENRLLDLNTSPDGADLRAVAPGLRVVTPPELAAVVYPRQP